MFLFDRTDFLEKRTIRENSLDPGIRVLISRNGLVKPKVFDVKWDTPEGHPQELHGHPQTHRKWIVRHLSFIQHPEF